MIKGLKKTQLEKREHPKGNVFNLVIDGLNLYEMPIIYRAKGSKGEFHYHTGDDPSNDPQKVLVIKGRMKLNFEDLKGNKESMTLEEGELLEIPKFTLHDYEILEETIFTELRLNDYTKNKIDKYFLDDFIKLKK